MADVDGLLIPLSKRSVRRSSFVSSVFCSGVIDAERRRWRAPEKLRRIAAMVLSFERFSVYTASPSQGAARIPQGPRISNFTDYFRVPQLTARVVGLSGRCSLIQISAKRILAPASNRTLNPLQRSRRVCLLVSYRPLDNPGRGLGGFQTKFRSRQPSRACQN